jgi:hypothetical protein
MIASVGRGSPGRAARAARIRSVNVYVDHDTAMIRCDSDRNFATGMWRQQSAGGGVITRFALAPCFCASAAAPCQRCSTGDRQRAAQQAKLRRRVGGARCWACACTRGDRGVGGAFIRSLLHAESAPCVPRHPPRCRATVPCMCSDARVNQLYVSRRRMHSGGAAVGTT